MEITNKELNLIPLFWAGTDGRLPGGLMKRGLLEEFQITTEGNPTTARRVLNLDELSRDSKSMSVDINLPRIRH
jgi:hypothetical protein